MLGAGLELTLELYSKQENRTILFNMAAIINTQNK
jgi:hypothetical protein